MWRVAALIWLIFLVVLHAQKGDVQRWVLVTPPETVSVADVSIRDIEVLQDDTRRTNADQPFSSKCQFASVWYSTKAARAVALRAMISCWSVYY